MVIHPELRGRVLYVAKDEAQVIDLLRRSRSAEAFCRDLVALGFDVRPTPAGAMRSELVGLL